MSVETTTADAAAPFDTETKPQNITRSFKPTDENKTETLSISLNAEVKEKLEDMMLRSGRWRSFGQLVNDAVIYYLNTDTQKISVEKILDGARWNSENTKSAAVTETLFNEIDLMVKNGHTPWDTKQELYICALFCYLRSDFPVVERR